MAAGCPKRPLQRVQFTGSHADVEGALRHLHHPPAGCLKELGEVRTKVVGQDAACPAFAPVRDGAGVSNVVEQVGEDHVGQAAIHDLAVALRVEGVATDHAVGPHEPDIPSPGYRPGRHGRDIALLHRVPGIAFPLRAPTVLDWTKSNDDFSAQYARAREKGYQCMADERGRARASSPVRAAGRPGEIGTPGDYRAGAHCYQGENNGRHTDRACATFSVAINGATAISSWRTPRIAPALPSIERRAKRP